MKKILVFTFVLWLVLALSINANSQTIYRADKHIYKTTATDTITGDVFIDIWGKGHPLYKTKNNKLFYYMLNKNGKQYKRYPRIMSY